MGMDISFQGGEDPPFSSFFGDSSLPSLLRTFSEFFLGDPSPFYRVVFFKSCFRCISLTLPFAAAFAGEPFFFFITIQTLAGLRGFLLKSWIDLKPFVIPVFEEFLEFVLLLP